VSGQRRRRDSHARKDVLYPKTRLLGQAQRFREHGFRDMTCRLTEKQLPACLRAAAISRKNRAASGTSCTIAKDKREVDLSLQRFDTHARWPCQPRLDLFLQPCATRPPFEAVEHFSAGCRRRRHEVLCCRTKNRLSIALVRNRRIMRLRVLSEKVCRGRRSHVSEVVVAGTAKGSLQGDKERPSVRYWV